MPSYAQSSHHGPHLSRTLWCLSADYDRAPREPLDAGNLARSGLRIGDIPVGGRVEVRSRVRLPNVKPGTELRYIGVVTGTGLNEFYNNTFIKVE